MKSSITGRVSVVIDATAQEVWTALTDPALIKQYFFGTDAKSTWQPGSPIIFEGEYQGKAYRDKGIIKKVDPFTHLTYSHWSPLSGIEDKPENYMDVTYNLEQVADKTTLTVVQENIPDEKTKSHSEENWRKVLASLKELVEKHAEPDAIR